MLISDSIKTITLLALNFREIKLIQASLSSTITSKKSRARYLIVKYYLIYKQECFIRYKTRGAAERFIFDKVRIASILNSFKHDPFYTHLVSLFAKEFSI